ncbi:hypothetical protein SETIT_3G210700v2 [Setaria italica]|uniref:DUF1618 domain-containing protein n=1 Tax=Setaria italica TaxID=4555 RepID=K3ZCA7_SETIT|nr:hypothetical protein SETIT_3G210700v2 [Setaria italica]RCV17320.1 hypothetical protein SETIT_3G210700v2 [Setaria italica]
MLFRRILGLSATVSGRLRRGLSTAASHPPWAMIYRTELVKSPAPGTSIQLGAPPRASTLFVPDHLVDLRPCPDPDSDIVAFQGGMVSATSGDGLLLLDFTDARGTAPIVDTPGGRCRKLIGLDLDPDVTRFVCNPLSGQLLRLPDIDGTKKTASSNNFGILTRSAHGHGPPDRYVVAELSDDRDAEEGSFVMRRFPPETGVWEKLVGLPSPLPLPRRMDIYHEVLAFAGRLWWVDLSWGAVSADPFSDRPELSFVELPSASVLPVPSTIAEYDAAREVQGVYRRLGVSEGRLRYVELSQKMPFLLSSFVLDEDGRSWTLEHQMALGVLWEKIDPPPEEHYPRIGVVDPLN